MVPQSRQQFLDVLNLFWLKWYGFLQYSAGAIWLDKYQLPLLYLVVFVGVGAFDKQFVAVQLKGIFVQLHWVAPELTGLIIYHRDTTSLVVYLEEVDLAAQVRIANKHAFVAKRFFGDVTARHAGATGCHICFQGMFGPGCLYGELLVAQSLPGKVLGSVLDYCIHIRQDLMSIEVVLYPLEGVVYGVTEARIGAGGAGETQYGRQQKAFWPAILKVEKMGQVRRAELVALQPVAQEFSERWGYGVVAVPPVCGEGF